MFWKKFRLSWNKMLVISILINIGMLSERFIIVATSQPRKFLPDAFGFYFPSWIELTITFGSFAVFASLFLIFIKWVPAISIYEVKETLKPLRRDS
jgi:molybdopterin-containing oxidoreductase family membrane subunit